MVPTTHPPSERPSVSDREARLRARAQAADLFALNDVCRCGHSGSEHYANEPWSPGRGICSAGGCTCSDPTRRTPAPDPQTLCQRNRGWGCGRGHGTFVYVLTDFRGPGDDVDSWRFLYVGQTSDPQQRMAQHRAIGRNTSHVLWIRCSNVMTADILETYLIDRWKPRENRQAGAFDAKASCWNGFPIDPWPEAVWICGELGMAPVCPVGTRFGARPESQEYTLAPKQSYWLPGNYFWLVESVDQRPVTIGRQPTVVSIRARAEA